MGNLSEKPRIFFVGAPKCGTTSLHRLLHGEGIIDAGSRKETFYFDYQYARGRGWYESLYETSGPHIPKADFTPTYLYSTDARSRIKDEFPDAKIVILVRDPLSRTISHIKDLNNWTVIPATLCQQTTVSVDRGRFCVCFNPVSDSLYSRYVGEWILDFGDANVLILKSENLFDQTELEIEKLLDFIKSDASPKTRKNL